MILQNTKTGLTHYQIANSNLRHSNNDYRAVTIDSKGDIFNSVADALEAAKSTAAKDDLIFVGGSVFVVAEVI